MPKRASDFSIYQSWPASLKMEWVILKGRCSKTLKKKNSLRKWYTLFWSNSKDLDNSSDKLKEPLDLLKNPLSWLKARFASFTLCHRLSRFNLYSCTSCNFLIRSSSRVLHIMLVFFRAFNEGKSIGYYSSILVALFLKNCPFRKKRVILGKMTTETW